VFAADLTRFRAAGVARIALLLALGGGPQLLAPAAAAQPATAAAIRFEDATGESGLDFVYRAGGAAELQLPAIMGGGAALFDLEGDGDLDLFFVQGGRLGPAGPEAGADAARLYRNDPVTGADGRRRARFVDITRESAAGVALYGMGVATGDVDGDGFVDLFVAGFGASRLLRNVAGTHFEEISARAGMAAAGEAGMAISAAFFDADRDGDLDLFVARYVDYPLDPALACFAPSSRRDYCGPQAFRPQRDLLYINRGDGTFTEEGAVRLGKHRPQPGLGVVAADLDGDGWVDLFVANDGQPNHLWRNLGGARSGPPAFAEVGLASGVAVNRSGLPEASMGIAIGDADGDLLEDLLVTHLTGETNTFYRNSGGLFDDRSLASGLGPPSRPWTSFGTAWVDPDRDGDLDLVTVAGAVRLAEVGGQPQDPLGLGQPAQLFRNDGRGRFAEISALAGPVWARRATSHGLAAGDVDNDGDLDLVVVDTAERARLLLDESPVPAPAAWLGLRLTDASGRRDQLGATALLRRRGAPPLLRRAHSDGSYASASDPRLLFGLGGGVDLEAVEVSWPDGRREHFPPPPPGAYATLREGQGQEPAAPLTVSP